MVSKDQKQAGTRLAVDFDRTKRILAEIWGIQQGWVFLPHRYDGYWAESPGLVYGGSLATVPPLNNRGDCYFSPLVFIQPSRKSEFACSTRVLWADLDEADPRKTRLRPSIACETTGGDIPHYQAYWLLDEHIPAREAAALSRRIAYREPKADRSGWDITQVLRLPGTLNHKHNPPQPVRVLWAKRLYYPVAAVEAAYPAVQLESTAAAPISSAELSEVELWRTRLPQGLRYALQRPTDGADRSAQLFRLAQGLLKFGCPEPVVVGLLQTSTWNKFRGRSDEFIRLAAVVQQAVDRRR